MASLLCAANVASASLLHTKAPIFTSHGIHPSTRRATTTAWPAHSRSSRLPVLRASSGRSPRRSARYIEDPPIFGPPGILLMGLSYSELLKVQQLLQDMQAQNLKVLVYTNEMIRGTLWDVMHSSQPGPTRVQGVQGAPRLCIFSGLGEGDVMNFVSTFLDAGLEPLAFKLMGQVNAGKTMEELAHIATTQENERLAAIKEL